MGFISDGLINMALKKIGDTILMNYLDGIGTIEEIAFKDKRLRLRVLLEGLDTPLEVECSGIRIADDGSHVRIERFASNMPFAHNALARFAAGREFPIPEGNARMAAIGAKKVLRLG